MVQKPLSNSNATSFYATLKFLISKKENFEIFEKMLRVGKVKENHEEQGAWAGLDDNSVFQSVSP